MRDDVDAQEFDRRLERYVEARKTRRALKAAIPGKLLDGTGPDSLTAWLVSLDGNDRVRQVLEALKQERKALNSLEKFARLRVETHPSQTKQI